MWVEAKLESESLQFAFNLNAIAVFFLTNWDYEQVQ